MCSNIMGLTQSDDNSLEDSTTGNKCFRALPLLPRIMSPFSPGEREQPPFTDVMEVRSANSLRDQHQTGYLSSENLLISEELSSINMMLEDAGGSVDDEFLLMNPSCLQQTRSYMVSTEPEEQPPLHPIVQRPDTRQPDQMNSEDDGATFTMVSQTAEPTPKTTADHWVGRPSINTERFLESGPEASAPINRFVPINDEEEGARTRFGVRRARSSGSSGSSTSSSGSRFKLLPRKTRIHDILNPFGSQCDYVS